GSPFPSAPRRAARDHNPPRAERPCDIPLRHAGRRSASSQPDAQKGSRASAVPEPLSRSADNQVTSTACRLNQQLELRCPLLLPPDVRPGSLLDAESVLAASSRRHPAVQCTFHKPAPAQSSACRSDPF